MLDLILSALLIGVSFALFLECRSHSRTLGRLHRARDICETLASKNTALRDQLRPFRRVKDAKGRFVGRDSA